MDESRSLGEAIRQLRVHLGMSQEELAERIGPDVRQSDVSRLERGRILFPRLERLQQIANALGVSVGALLVEAGWFSDEEAHQVHALRGPEPGTEIPIVVADDEPVSLDAIASLLGDYGYRAATAYDFDSLIEVFGQALPEVVIVDIALPGLKPDELAELLSLRSPAPILVYMGVGLPEIEEVGPYLEKPIDSKQLLAFVSSINKKRLPPIPAATDNGHRSKT